MAANIKNKTWGGGKILYSFESNLFIKHDLVY